MATGTPSKLPPLPEGMPCWTVRRVRDGADVVVITVQDAATLAGVRANTLRSWIEKGKIAICYTPESEVRVILEDLWQALPAAMKR
jgi:hypothetical protein